MIIENKSNNSNELLRHTENYRDQEILSFLAGYSFAKLEVSLVLKETKFLYKKFDQMRDLIQDKMLTRKNLVYITMDSLDEIKNKFPKKNSDKEIITKFIEAIDYNVGETALDQYYIINKWQRQWAREEEAIKNQIALKKMLSEEDKQYDKIREIKQKQESVGWECQICNVQMKTDDFGCLGCGHLFHPQCIHSHLKACIEANEIEIRCPMEDCGQYLEPADILSYIDGDLRQKFEKFSFNKFLQKNTKTFSWCPTAGCTAAFEFDEALDNYRCVACKKHYCLKCRCLYHTGMSCAEYRISNSFSEDDKKFVDFVKGAKFKQCPKCSFWVERNQGCPSMKCRCGQQFCYDCGGIGCPHGSCSNSGNIKK